MKERILNFFKKIWSVKILLWYTPATILMFMEKIPWWAWLISAGMIFATRETTKILLAYFKKNED